MRIRILSIFALIFVLCIGVVLAQTTSGSITGNVVDAQRAAIANATITITDVDKGFTQTATTDEQGRFVFPQVPPGTFDIVIEATGFKKQVITRQYDVGSRGGNGNGRGYCRSDTDPVRKRGTLLRRAERRTPKYRNQGSQLC